MGTNLYNKTLSYLLANVSGVATDMFISVYGFYRFIYLANEQLLNQGDKVLLNGNNIWLLGKNNFET